tara:strand:+ start:3648 stop:4844 length:1197 start_codon:yes stop_codon:yes gene_type:complete
MNKKSILRMDLQNKRIIVRADLNVPINNNKIADETRIKRFCKGILKLIHKGAKLIILTHLGRPKGVINPNLSTRILVESLEKNLDQKVVFSSGCIDKKTIAKSKTLEDNQVLLCENLRFHNEEEENNSSFAQKLAQLGDYFLNDAFSCSHRAHASTDAITRFLPSFFGPMMSEEINALNEALENPEKPSLAIIGGSKVSTKISVLKNLVYKLDNLIIGGGMANTFLYASGSPMGKSLYEPDFKETVNEIHELAKMYNCKIFLPIDIVVSKDLIKNTDHKVVEFDECPSDHMILDIGQKSIELYKKIIRSSKTILWNGPLGAFETKPFDNGTNALAKYTSLITMNKGCISVAGGGDTLSALNSINVTADFTYVSSAGGAFLEWLEGKELPGIKAIYLSE